MIELLKKLIGAESSLAVGEVEAANVLAGYFAEHGIECEVDVWEDIHANATVHIKSNAEKPALLFAAHIDVVPANDARWICPPFVGVENEGKIYGRGSCDMKGGIAATAEAIVEILKDSNKLKGDLIFTSTAGEETTSDGIKRFVKKYASHMPTLAGIVIPEPTRFDIITAHRGILWLKITTRGKTAHGSMPHLGINAIGKMQSLLNIFESFVVDCQEHDRLGRCSMSVNKISGGSATNVIPAECSIEVDIRTLPGQNHETIINDFKNLFEQIGNSDLDFKADIEVIRSIEAMETDEDSQFVRAFCKSVEISETKAVGYTTDGSFLKSLNKPIVVFGPGDTGLCHQPNEYIEIEDLHKAKEYFKRIILHHLT